ncbi:MAG TPA: patatin-like phospholipase family protein [Bryobacteraceae bacterium]|nr:patatin-like phospholipase family protein [Bryobacteraceae bacterium]
MAKFKIMAMAGGLGTTLSSMLHGLNNTLHGTLKDYMNHVDLFAGTSVGAMTALFFANHEDPSEALNDWDNFTQQAFQDVMKAENLPSLVGAFLGFNSIFNVQQLREFLIRYFGKDLRLGELKKKVLIVSFQLDSGLPGNARRWQPKVFTNFDGEADNDQLVVDVALRTSALPIGYPLYQSLAGTGPGYVDGFVVANNPSMIAITQMMDQVPLDNMLLLAITTGANIIGKTMYLDPQFSDGLAAWGYRQWMLDPSRPLLLLDLMSQANGETVSYQSRKLLGDRYHVLNPPLVNELVPDDAETKRLLQETADWLKASGWYDPALAA